MSALPRFRKSGGRWKERPGPPKPPAPLPPGSIGVGVRNPVFAPPPSGQAPGAVFVQTPRPGQPPAPQSPPVSVISRPRDIIVGRLPPGQGIGPILILPGPPGGGASKSKAQSRKKNAPEVDYE